MTALAKIDIEASLSHKDQNERLYITPLLDIENVIGPCSVDLRLGNQFYSLKQGSVSHLDPKDTNTDIHRVAQRVVVPYGKPFIAHPNQFILGSSLEYLRLPNNLMAYVTSRSRWGRMGLITATATKIDPGFTGCITLEIVNEGQVPVHLFPGLRIAQIIFHKTLSTNEYKGIFSYQTGPVFPAFPPGDGDSKFWFTNKH